MNITTQALIDAALARGLELPGEWFQDEHWQCQRCGKALHPYQVTHGETHDSACGGECVVVPAIPDLTAPANLYELMRFADAIFKSPPNIAYVGEPLSPHKFLCAGDAEECCDTEAYGPDRTTAVLAACAKALGLEGAG